MMYVCMYVFSSALSSSSRASSPSSCEDMILSGLKYPVLKQLRYYHRWNRWAAVRMYWMNECMYCSRRIWKRRSQTSALIEWMNECCFIFIFTITILTSYEWTSFKIASQSLYLSISILYARGYTEVDGRYCLMLRNTFKRGVGIVHGSSNTGEAVCVCMYVYTVRLGSIFSHLTLSDLGLG